MKRIAAFLLSLAVHAVTLGCLVFGVVTVWRHPAFLPSWLLGAIFVAIGVLLRPRVRTLPRDAELLDPGSAPVLYGVADRLADQVGVPRPALVAVRDLTVETGYQRVGLRRTPVLVVGLPLWLALSPRQRAVLLAGAYAEAGADVGIVVEGALSTLAVWRESLLGTGPLERRHEAHMEITRELAGWGPDAGYEAASTLGRAIGRVFGWPVLLLERLLTRLARRENARTAEQARERVRRAATDEELRELGELMAGGSYLAPMQAAVLRGESVGQIRQDALTRTRLSDDGVLTSAPGSPLLDAADSAAIDAELERHYARAVGGFGLIS